MRLSINDTSSIVTRAFATAAASLCRLASFSAVERYVRKCLELGDLNTTDSRDQMTAAVALQQLTRRAGDKIKPFYALIVPVVCMVSINLLVECYMARKVLNHDIFFFENKKGGDILQANMK